jgi:hypothetical protein
MGLCIREARPSGQRTGSEVAAGTNPSSEVIERGSQCFVGWR